MLLCFPPLSPYRRVRPPSHSLVFSSPLLTFLVTFTAGGRGVGGDEGGRRCQIVHQHFLPVVFSSLANLTHFFLLSLDAEKKRSNKRELRSPPLQLQRKTEDRFRSSAPLWRRRRPSVESRRCGGGWIQGTGKKKTGNPSLLRNTQN